MSDSTLKVLEAGVGGTDLGAISVMQGVTPVKLGKQTIVDQTGAEVLFAKDASVTAVTTSLGTDGATPPTIAGTGVRGWLRAIYERLLATLTVSGTVTANAGTGNFTVTQATAANLNANVSGTVSVGNFPATQAVSGTVTVTQATAGNLNATVTGSVSLASGANSIGNIGTVATITNPVSVTDNGGSLTVDGTITANQGTAGASPWPVSDGGGSLTVDGTVSVGNFPATQNVAITGQGTTTANPLQVQDKSCDLSVTATGAAAAANTATLPAVAGQFHHITGIEILLYTTAARTASATPVTVTTTNFTSAVTFLFSSGGAVGGADRILLAPDRPIRSATAGTATTIVCPATTGGLWHVKVFYYTSA